MTPNAPHPSDLRNIVIFIVCALVFYWAWDTYMVAPRAAKANKAMVASDAPPSVPPAKPLSRTEALAQSPRLYFETAQVSGSIALRGGVLDDLSLRAYFVHKDKKDPVFVLSPKGGAFSRSLSWGWTGAESVAFPDSTTLWRVQGNAKLTPKTPITLEWDNGAGLVFTRTFAVDENFMFTITQNVENKSTKPVSLYPFARVNQTGLPIDAQGSWISHEGPIGYIGDTLEERTYKSLHGVAAEVLSAREGWIGITDKYWLAALIPAQGKDTRFGVQSPKDGQYQVDTLGATSITIPAGQKVSQTSHAFVGAKKVLLLGEYGKALGIPNFDLAIDFGWFYFLSKPFFYLLNFLGGLTGNWGVAIILMTLLIRGAAFPLTNFSYRSFANMKKIAPEMLILKEKYGKDPARMQTEVMKLYTEHGVNPMAGCFPILLQIPIFFALYKVLFITIETRQEPFIGWISDLSAPEGVSIFNAFGLLPYDVPSFLQIGLLPCIMLVALLIQKNLNPPPQDVIQRDLQNYFPFIMVFMLAHFPSGLVLYWACSSMFTVVQQIIIMRSMGMEIHLFRKTKAEEQLESQLNKPLS